ncbi:DNA replication terminus site-binding protein [Affinibrenneria salicis]|uniref:DNA replication terminus site-binding protein n=1 Tax=Affinibrenneria salicis TaxID=2590031 RepID=A0A5J5G4R2_9GAMM|nr:DNA replication terminus site-binding protein [Affinibrenneria salicis]KAA9001863.1 DNA replication terminus site-binding protein [Affinibrenneria salicis]
MTRYDLIERLNRCFRQLEAELFALRDQLLTTPLLAARLFTLPPVLKGHEHDPIHAIRVETLEGPAALRPGLRHFHQLFIHHYPENISSKSAIRLPGALCFAVDARQYQHVSQRVADINALKQELERIVTVETGLEPEQRFEFVHSHLRGLITLSAYRTINVLTDPASVRFGWANKHVINNLTRAELLARLEKSLNAGRAVAPYSKQQWAGHIMEEIAQVRRLPENAVLKIKRPVKVQPIARVWYPAQQKQVQHPCPSPLIVLCQSDRGAQAPAIGVLNHYDAANVRHKYKPQAQTLRLLIPRLHLYTDQPE